MLTTSVREFTVLCFEKATARLKTFTVPNSTLETYERTPGIETGAF